MPRATWFVVQAFEKTKKGFETRPAIEARSEHQARAMAERLAEKGGAYAFSRSGDMDIGEYDQAVILGRWGEIPEYAEDQIAA